MRTTLILIAFLAASGKPMLESNNELRAIYHKRPMAEDARLTAAAQEQAAYLAVREHRPDPNNLMATSGHYQNGRPYTRAAKYGFAGREIRENIAQETLTPWEHWRTSQHHWETIMSDCTHVGFGHAVSPRGNHYWVALYGRE